MKPNYERQYLSLLQRLLSEGDQRGDRTGTGTRALFGETMKIDLGREFPLLLTKRVYYRTAFHEMLWMLSGSTNIRPLLEQGVRIWSDWPYERYQTETMFDPEAPALTQFAFEQKIIHDPEFAEKWGDLGPVYGKQWRNWDGVDQIEEVINQLLNTPESRRIILEAWNVAELDDMALPPCHKTYQWTVDSKRRLHCMMYQRSADVFLGLPFNIVNAAMLTELFVRHVGLEPGTLTWFGADVHLYNNHVEQAKEQLSRSVPEGNPSLLITDRRDNIDDYTIDDLLVADYNPMDPIHAQVSV